ncbi:MAG: hypothetical protein BMS9Abin07_1646 [Acidimicrobiia bacterium]|nr:MAG: hypothetical protein BMS9Abin07_1646 [Acidimicrobiia bacterium]
MTFTERGGWWVVGQLALLGLYVLGLLGTDPVSEGVALGFARGSGLALIAVATVIGLWSLILVRRSLSVFPAPTDNASLIRRGPFRLVRHPMYLAVVLGTVGLALAALNPSALVVALVFVPFFMAKSGHEEDLLMDRFPEYREYRSTVAYRIIPWVL